MISASPISAHLAVKCIPRISTRWPRGGVRFTGFPIEDKGTDGFRGLAPVACFTASEFGLYDMIGNVREWTLNLNAPGHRIVKGGSYLCALNYCANFQPAAWQAQEAGLPTLHIGFRTVAPSRLRNVLASQR